jgi:triosephosphate isomerase
MIINFKNYLEVSGQRTIDLSIAAQEIARDLKVEIGVAPPLFSISSVSQMVSLPVFCQHLDSVRGVASTGFLSPEIAKSFGAIGSILNHSEHPINETSISKLIERLRNLKMTTVVCAKSPEEVSNIAKFHPDFIAIEPPELIGSGRAVSKHDPLIITRSVQSKSEYSGSTRLLCGAGIVDKTDVSSAVRLGAEGILVSSSVVKASSWHQKIFELASGFEVKS